MLVYVTTPNVRYRTGCDGPVGFGFDDKTNDYKVVRLVTHENVAQYGESRHEVEIYSLATGERRMLTNAAMAPIGAVHGCDPLATLVNGALH